MKPVLIVAPNPRIAAAVAERKRIADRDYLHMPDLITAGNYLARIGQRFQATADVITWAGNGDQRDGRAA